MPKSTTILFLLLAATLVAQQSTMLPKNLSLKEAKEIALQANPTLQVATARIRAAAARLQEAQSDYYPRLDTVAGVQRTQEVARDNGGDANSHYTTYHAGLELTWTLFDGMARKYDNLAKQLGVNIAEHDHKDAQRVLLLAVATAYFNSLLELENIRIAQEDHKYNLDLKDTAQRKLDNGYGTRSDVLNFDIRAKDAEANLLEAELAVKTSHYVLAELLGRTQNDIPEGFHLNTAQDYTQTPEVSSVEANLQYAFENRPDLIAQAEAIKQQEAMVDVYDAENLPALEFFADYGFTRRSKLKFSDKDDNLVFGVQLRWNVFNGNATRAKVAQAWAAADQERQQLNVLRQEIQRQIASQHATTLQARKLADLKAETMKLAEETRNLVRKEYNIGRVTATRLNEAQTDLVNAQGDRVKAVIRYWQSRENLAAITGQNLSTVK